MEFTIKNLRKVHATLKVRKHRNSNDISSVLLYNKCDSMLQEWSNHLVSRLNGTSNSKLDWKMLKERWESMNLEIMED